MLIIFLVIFVFEIFIIQKIVRFYLLSQVYLYLFFYIIAVVLSTLYYYFYEDKISLFSLDFINNELFVETLKYHILSLIAFSLGVIIYYDLVNKKVKLLFNQSFSRVLYFRYKLPDKTKWVIVGLLFLIMTLYALTYGGKIFYREEYLISNYRALQTLIKLLSFITAVMLGVIYTENKKLSVLAFLALLIFTVGTGSRISFLYLIVYVILVFQAKGNTFKNKLTLFINLIVSFLFLSYIMTLRGNDSHGIYPYLLSVFEDKSKLFDSVVFNIYYSFIFGIFVSAKTMITNIPDWNNVIISLNPITGDLAGWYDISNKMRIYPIVPFSSNGEIFTMGKLFTFVFYLFLGIITTYFDYKTRSFFSIGKRVKGFIIVILFILYIVYSFEYNLRSSFRYIYYIFFMILIFSLRIKKIKYRGLKTNW